MNYFYFLFSRLSKSVSGIVRPRKGEEKPRERQCVPRRRRGRAARQGENLSSVSARSQTGDHAGSGDGGVQPQAVPQRKPVPGV